MKLTIKYYIFEDDKRYIKIAKTLILAPQTKYFFLNITTSDGILIEV